MLLAPAAWAHDADVIYVMLTDGADGGMDEVVTLTAGTLSQLAPVDADQDGALSQSDLDARADAVKAGVWEQMPLEAASRCSRTGEQAALRDGFVELTAHFACPPGELSQTFRILSVLTTNFKVVLGRQLDGASGRDFAQGNVQRLLIRPHPAPSAEASEPPLAAGIASLARSPGATLIWLWALLIAGSLGAAAGRTLAIFGPGAAVAIALAGLGWQIPQQLAWAPLGVGLAVAFAGLLRGGDRWAVLGLAVVSASEGLVGGPALFQLGRGLGLVGLAVIAVPILRILARRPGLKAKAAQALLCGAIFCFGFAGFSLIQTARGF